MRGKKAFVVSMDVGPRIRELEKAGVELYFWPNEVVPTYEQAIAEVEKIKPEILIKIGTDNLHIKGDFLDSLHENGIRIIGTRSTGLNLIDIQRTTELGIPVVYCPEVPSVAENTIGMMIGLMRKHNYALDIVRQGNWGLKKLILSNELGYCGKNLAIIGVGKIGKSFAAKVLSMGFDRILLHDIQPDYVFLERCKKAAESFYDLSTDILAAGKRHKTELLYTDKETALTESDIISLHLPLTTAEESEHPTWHYLSQEEFALMRRKPVIINTARGPVIDTPALIEALDGGKISGASLDVVEKEPLRPGDPFYESLRGRENVVLYPHYSARTVQTFDYMAEQVVRGISYLLQGTPGEGRNCIANPELL